jgi:AcrR family transcriptional regulator
VDETVKRPYRMRQRAERAAATRARVREAAQALFVEQGFTATTMRAIAAHAGVGERTLYDAFATKAALFEHVAAVAIAGDEAAVPVAERPAFQGVLAEREPDRAVALFAEYVTELLERAGPVIMVAVESAGADPAMREFNDRGAAATRANTAAFVTRLAERIPLGDTDKASATVFALTSPHVHHLLRVHSGLSPNDYRRWLEDALAALLLSGTGHEYGPDGEEP